jgi:hypothetical protein
MQAVVDPPDGSTLMFLSYLPPPEVDVTTFQITATGYAPNVASISLYGCDNGDVINVVGATTSDSFQAQCTGATNTILALGYDATMNLQSWGVVKNVAASPGQSVPVAVAMDQTNLQVFTQTISPIPAGAPVASASFAFQGFQYQGGNQIMSPSGTASMSFTLPALNGLPFYTTESVTLQEGAFIQGIARYQVLTAVPATLAFDPTALAVVTPDPVDASDNAHPKVHWSAGAGSQGQCVNLILSGGASYEIFLPAGSTSFRLPDVPASSTTYKPADTSKWSLLVELTAQDGVADWSQSFIFNVGQLALTEFAGSTAQTP